MLFLFPLFLFAIFYVFFYFYLPFPRHLHLIYLIELITTKSHAKRGRNTYIIWNLGSAYIYKCFFLNKSHNRITFTKGTKKCQKILICLVQIPFLINCIAIFSPNELLEVLTGIPIIWLSSWRWTHLIFFTSRIYTRFIVLLQQFSYLNRFSFCFFVSVDLHRLLGFFLLYLCWCAFNDWIQTYATYNAHR